MPVGMPDCVRYRRLHVFRVYNRLSYMEAATMTHYDILLPNGQFKGFRASLEHLKEYIETLYVDGYFKPLAGGVIEIIDLETMESVYEKRIL